MTIKSPIVKVADAEVKLLSLANEAIIVVSGRQIYCENGGTALASRSLQTGPDKGSSPAYATASLKGPNPCTFSLGRAGPVRMDENLECVPAIVES